MCIMCWSEVFTSVYIFALVFVLRSWVSVTWKSDVKLLLSLLIQIIKMIMIIISSSTLSHDSPPELFPRND